jgi:hypothetical protein
VPFQRLLDTLVARAPGARGAVFCDVQGEFVRLAIKDAALTEYELRAYGAHVAAPWLNLRTGLATSGAGGIVELKVGCPGGTLLCRALRDGYYLVLLLEHGRAAAPAAFEMARTAQEVAREL